MTRNFGCAVQVLDDGRGVADGEAAEAMHDAVHPQMPGPFDFDGLDFAEDSIRGKTAQDRCDSSGLVGVE